MNFQALMDAVVQSARGQRQSLMLTLGKLIAALEKMPPDTEVRNLMEPHSYRGYYSDLAFQEGLGTRTAGELLAECRECRQKSFEGYKGGDYIMSDDTPVWLADYGCCGVPLLKVTESGEFITGDRE